MRWISSYLSSAVAARRLSLALILALLGGLALAPMRVRAAGCTTSGPASGAYTITLCMTNPADGATVTGVQPVTATVTLSGSLPSLQWLAFYLDGQNLLSDYVSPYTFNLPSDRFVDGAARKGVDAETANLVYDKLAGFSGFGFPKSHAAAFGLLAYQSTWLRHHHQIGRAHV